MLTVVVAKLIFDECFPSFEADDCCRDHDHQDDQDSRHDDEPDLLNNQPQAGHWADPAVSSVGACCLLG